MAGKVASIVLAAGFSERMGEFKPLLPLGGITILERTVSLFQGAGIGDVRIVTGYRGAELEPLLVRLGARTVTNPRYSEGMFSSVVAGVATLGSEVDAFFVLPVDVPLVRPATIRRLLDLHRQEHADVIYPRFLGQRGHPPLIASRHAREIAQWQGEGGLKAALGQWESAALDVDVADGNILLDMDTPDAYGLLKKKVERLEIPTPEECQVLMENVLHVGDEIIRHGRAVALLATRLGDELNRTGCRLDIPLLEAAALLHDLAKGEPDHARRGARLLGELGFGMVAGPVATHMDITITADETINVGEVLYLADKMLQGERPLSPAERFHAKMERYAGDPGILDIITGRLETALAIQRRIETKVGRPLAEVISP
ncbi:MAG TPA: NTP transferase domain-containing protein [Geobacteraceae bacterium]|nr:NTP transferase domain-containing protein [Geobacteraceae bacterium]